jgi:hypothetical protein
LAFLELQRPGRQAEHRTPERNGAGRHHEHVGATGVEIGDILGQGGKPGVVEPAPGPIHEERGADL